MKSVSLHLLFLLLVVLAGCLEPFAPPDSNKEIDFLVVDAFLNSTEGSLQVRLTRAQALNTADPYPSETLAEVVLENESGANFSVPEILGGHYVLTGLSIDPDLKYRLKIRTIAGKEYVSNFVEVVQTPPIDSVVWRPGTDAVEVLVNTHDDEGKTRFYQWRYIETWQYQSPQHSSFKFEDGRAVFRELHERLSTCWATQPSTKILVRSTNRLNADIIRDFKVTSLPAGSRKISSRYSILVQQSGLSQEAYEFWLLLEQTTQNIGGLFDPQPGKVIGNIHSTTDPGEPVLGIFLAGSVVEKRLFFSYIDLPSHLRINIPRQECTPDSLDVEFLPGFNSAVYHLVNQITEGLTVVGYTYAPHRCTDCRYEGGSLTKPDFWE